MCEIREIGKCEFAWVGFVANTEEADRVSDDVAVGPDSVFIFWYPSAWRYYILLESVLAGFNTGLLFRVPVQPSEDQLGLRFDLGQFSLNLR